MTVCMIASITADGFIAQTQDHFTNWTSPEDKKLFVKITKEAGHMVMGSRTFATIGRALPGRKTIIYTMHPEKLHWPEADNDAITTTQENPRALIARLESEGIKSLAVCGGSEIYTLFAEAGVLDEVFLTVEPLVFGTGISLFTRPLDVHLELLDSDLLNASTMLLHYKVVNASDT